MVYPNFLTRIFTNTAEMCTGLGLDWIRAIANFVEFATCCVRRKVIRKGVGNVTKNGKALLAKIHEICCEEI